MIFRPCISTPFAIYLPLSLLKRDMCVTNHEKAIQIFALQNLSDAWIHQSLLIFCDAIFRRRIRLQMQSKQSASHHSWQEWLVGCWAKGILYGSVRDVQRLWKKRTSLFLPASELKFLICTSFELNVIHYNLTKEDNEQKISNEILWFLKKQSTLIVHETFSHFPFLSGISSWLFLGFFSSDDRQFRLILFIVTAVECKKLVQYTYM